MRSVKLAGLDVVLAGGEDREGGGDGPVVVLLHGFGAPGDDLVPLWRVLDVPKSTRFVFPAAVLSLASMGFGAGRAWWHIDMAAVQRGDRRLTTEVPPGLEEARENVFALLDHIATDWKVPSSRLVLGGFSQGAMLSLDVALRRKDPLAGVVILSGTLIAEGQWRPLLAEARSEPRMPIFQSHGSSDPILPFSLAETLRDVLKGAGHDVTWCPFRGGHEIPSTALSGAGAFLSRALG